MSTKNYTFEGPCQWAKLIDPDQKYGHYCIDVQLDEAQQKVYKEAGCQSKLRNGYATFRRAPKRLTAKGDLLDFGKPTVTDAAGNAFDKLIGNGSKVRVNVSVYDTSKGPGTRLNSVTVLDHVEFVKQPQVQVAGVAKVNVPF